MFIKFILGSLLYIDVIIFMTLEILGLVESVLTILNYHVILYLAAEWIYFQHMKNMVLIFTR